MPTLVDGTNDYPPTLCERQLLLFPVLMVVLSQPRVDHRPLTPS